MDPFDLNKAIAAWRQNLECSGTFVSEDVDELEAHLRDHVDALTAGGTSPNDAFRSAMHRLGSRSNMESEYRKVRFARRKRRASLTNWTLLEWELHKNYLITALRNVRRNKVYALINILGLAVGISACLLMGLYVSDELSFDRFHENADRIAVVGMESHGRNILSTPYPLASALEADLPEVERSVRLLSLKREIRDDPRAETLDFNVAFTEPAFLDVFSFPLILGSTSGALADPNSAILTRETAVQLFGTEDAIGRTVLLDYRGTERLLSVTAVAEDPPIHSTIQFDVISPLLGLADQVPMGDSWGASMYRTFVLLENANQLRGLEERINRVADLRDTRDEKPTYLSEPLTDLYLSDLYPTPGFRGSRRYVYIFSLVSLLVLLIAAINYVNLSTAMAMRRTKEVGVRKTLGAERFQLIRQFSAESILLSGTALVVALVLSRAFLAGFNHLFGKELSFKPDLLLLGLCLAALIVGIAAGGYPALILARLRPTSIFSGTSRMIGRGHLRHSLVVFQFGITVALIIGTAVIFRQLEFTQTKDLGFDGEQVISVNLPRGPFWETRDVVRNEASGHPAVVSATVSNSAPASFSVRLGFRKDEMTPVDDGGDETVMLAPAVVDHDFVSTLGLTLLAGRDFSRDHRSDESQGYILNETAARALDWSAEEAIGKPFALGGGGGEDTSPSFGVVIGVVEDFHISSLKDEIEPVVLHLRDHRSWSARPLLLAKLAPEAIPAAMNHLQGIVDRMAPGEAFTYEFLDDRFDAMYREEERLGKIFSSFAALAVFLACLGLFGLSAYAAQSRTKEIGIRKVMGASVGDVVALLSRKYLVLVMIGYVIAAPASYFIMNKWLEDFAYRIEISIILIGVIGLVTIGFALFSVSYQSAKAAIMNPVESLRYE